MTIQQDLDAWWAEITDLQEGNSAKAVFQDVMTSLDENLDKLDEMNNNGDFDSLPASVKAKMVTGWQALDGVRDSLKADADFMAVISWRP